MAWSKTGNIRGPQGDRGDAGPQGPPGVVSSASAYVIVGPGRPDQPNTTAGVITGSEPVGAEYRSTDGANVGAWTWRKRGTGWAVVDGDTGWRTAVTGFSGSVRVKRTISGVTVIGRMVTGPSGWLFNVSMTGFTASTGMGGASLVLVTDSATVNGQIRIGSRDLPYLTLTSATTTTDFVYRYDCETTWPSTLPGAPA